MDTGIIYKYLLLAGTSTGKDTGQAGMSSLMDSQSSPMISPRFESRTMHAESTQNVELVVQLPFCPSRVSQDMGSFINL
jgi:hypothetical protein